MRRILIAKAVATAAVSFACLHGAARAEVSEITLGRANGPTYLPFMIMEHEKLLEKHVAAQGLPSPKISYKAFAAGAALKDSIVGGQIQIGSGGVPPFLQLWDKTRTNLKVKALVGMSLLPMYLNVRNPEIKTIADFTGKDRIAVGVVKSALQAILIQMAAAKIYGVENYDKLDKWTVGLALPDAMIAFTSGKGDITADFTIPPYHYHEIKQPGVRTVIDSTEILGGPSTATLVFAPTKFHDENPKTIKAFYAAYKEALDLIDKDKRKAAEIYLKVSGVKTSTDEVLHILDDPKNGYSVAPKNMMKYADFMHRVGGIGTKPSLKEMFFPNDLQTVAGN
jgi:NitT/TauT family transport system substrate-binding protein